MRQILFAFALLIVTTASACGSRGANPSPSASPSASPTASASADVTITADISPSLETNDAVLAEVTRLQDAGTLTDVIVRESFPVQITATGPKSVIENLQAMAKGESPTTGDSVSFTSLSQQGSRRKTAGMVVAGDQASFTKLWKEHTGSSENMPSVDFSKSAVIAIFAGEKSTAGYSVEVTAIKKSGQKLDVTYQVNEPKGDFNAQVISYPAQLVTVSAVENKDFTSVNYTKTAL